MSKNAPDKKALGIYGKFTVTRNDGQSAPGEKHERCDYFVLDITHDPFALPALQAYAEACRAGGYAQLADDLDTMRQMRVLRDLNLGEDRGR